MNIDWENLGFKFMPTRSNIRFHYENGQWDEGKLYDTYDITLSVAANAFHYGQALFEGGKAFRCKDGKVRIFRPEGERQTPEQFRPPPDDAGISGRQIRGSGENRGPRQRRLHSALRAPAARSTSAR